MPLASIQRFVRELRRRRVFRVSVAYLVVAGGVCGVADTVIPNLGLPQAWVTAVIVLALLGFPLAVVLAWAYDIVPDGALVDARSPDAGPARVPEAQYGPVRTNNLPRRLTTFVGRAVEVADTARLLSQHRLVTITGVGGVGKTSLAVQVAEETMGQYRDGVWLVDLAPLVDEGLLAHTVATVLDVREHAGEALADTLGKRLRDKELLILLDNGEHLVSACATLAESLLRECTRLRILTTSREKLGVTGEAVYSLSPLPSPEAGGDQPLEAIDRLDSVRLFVDRARAVSPSFALTAENATAVAHICAQLDGIPLAIELAAARLDVLSVDDLATRLNDRFTLLSKGSRTAQPRQQTLRALLDWSFELLSPVEKLLLERLSVFAGGWTLDAAESVCPGEGIEENEVLDALTGLVTKSLVLHDMGPQRTRYRLLETVRRYAEEGLSESSGADVVGERHSRYFLSLAVQAQPHMVGPEEVAWLDRLEREHDNLRVAIRRSSRVPSLAGLAVQAAYPLARFWRVRGYISEGQAQIASLIELGVARGWSSDLARALHGAGWLARDKGAYDVAREMFERALAMAESVDDAECVAWALIDLAFVERYEGSYECARERLEEARRLCERVGQRAPLAAVLGNLGLVARDVGDHGLADSLLRESLAVARELGDRLGIAWPLTNLGLLASYRGDLASARHLLNEALGIWRELGDRQNIAYALSNLGDVATKQGDLPFAATNLHESLALLRRAGDLRGIAFVLERYAVLALAGGDPKLALTTAARAAALRDAIGAPQPPAVRQEYASQMDEARRRLSQDEAAGTWERGSRLELDEVVTLLSSSGERALA